MVVTATFGKNLRFVLYVTVKRNWWLKMEKLEITDGSVCVAAVGFEEYYFPFSLRMFQKLLLRALLHAKNVTKERAQIISNAGNNQLLESLNRFCCQASNII